MIGALALLTGATLFFAYAQSLPMLFGARMLQGVADAATKSLPSSIRRCFLH